MSQYDALFLFPDEAAAVAALPQYRDRWGRDEWDGSCATPVTVVTKAAEFEEGDPDPETGEPRRIVTAPEEVSPGYWLGISTANADEAAGWEAHPACMAILDRDASASEGKLVCTWISPALAEPDRDPPRTAAERIAAVKGVWPVYSGSAYAWGSDVIDGGE